MKEDLLLDEPGLRLHPRTQRRLLSFLGREARNRSVWAVSHDGVFLGSPAVSRRFYVRRLPGADRSVVEELADRDATRAALVDLGWEPADALLADKVLFCEGPSDRIALEGVRSWLEEKDATWGGIVIAELGGDGAVLGGNPEVRHRIELAQRVAPRAELVVLLDSGGRTREEQEQLERRLADLGARLVLLQRSEIENYWLAPELAHAVLVQLVAETAEHTGRPAAAPDIEAVRAVLRDLPHDTKGSNALGLVWRLVPMEYRKKKAASPSIQRMRDLAGEDATALEREVQAAFSR